MVAASGQEGSAGAVRPWLLILLGAGVLAAALLRPGGEVRPVSSGEAVAPAVPEPRGRPVRKMPDDAAARALSDLVLGSKASGDPDAARDGWMASLEALRAAGTESVEAIAAFLADGRHVPLTAPVAEVAGRDTLRLVLLDLLVQRAVDGDAAAESALAGAIAVLTQPAELAVAGAALDRISPSRHAESLVRAAGEGLQASAQLGADSVDVAPLFGLLKALGTPSALETVRSISTEWPDYAAWCAAGWPEATGLMVLEGWIDAPPSPENGRRRTAALGQVAELTLQSDAARRALLKAVEGGKVGGPVWSRLSQALAGDRLEPLGLADPSIFDEARTGRYPDPGGGQGFLTHDGLVGASPDRLGTQVAFIEQLRERVADPEALAMLDWARDRLAQGAAGGTGEVDTPASPPPP